MKKTLCLLILSLSIYASSAQEFDSIPVYRIVTDMPEFPGGQEAMFQFIAENTVYPQQAKDSNITGIAYIYFVVEKDGSISNVRESDIHQHANGSLVDEGIRVVKLMPNWSPGKQRGYIRVSFVLPIEFTLSDDKEKTKKEIRKEKRRNKN